MSRVKQKDTLIEIDLRRALWKSGLRYRKNYKKLPGKPDIVFLKQKLAVFCDSGFWHGKNWEVNKTKFTSNKDFWINKIERNMARDKNTDKLLEAMGWKVLRFWDDEINDNLNTCLSTIKQVLKRV